METLQNILNDDSRDENSDESYDDEESNTKSFMIHVNDDMDTPRAKKILEAIDHLNTKSMSVVFNAAEIPANFSPIPSEKPLVEAYKNIYVKLFTASKIPQPQKLNEEETISDEEEEEELPKKKVKLPDEKKPVQEEFPISSAHELQKLTGNGKMAPIKIASMGLQDDISNSPSDDNPITGEANNVNPEPRQEFKPKEPQKETFEDRMKKAAAQMSSHQMNFQNLMPQSQSQTQPQTQPTTPQQPQSNMMDVQKQMLMKMMQQQQGNSTGPGSQNQTPMQQPSFANFLQQQQAMNIGDKKGKQPAAGGNPSYPGAQQPGHGMMGSEGMFPGGNAGAGGNNYGMFPNNMMPQQLGMLQQYQNLLNQHYMASMMMQQMMRQDPKSQNQNMGRPGMMPFQMPNQQPNQNPGMNMMFPNQMNFPNNPYQGGIPNMSNMPNMPGMQGFPNMGNLGGGMPNGQNMPNMGNMGNMQFPYGMNFPANPPRKEGEE